MDLHGGELLDTPEKTAACPDGHRRTCEGCGREFYSARLAGRKCYGCWYGGQIEAAEGRFRPLAEELERLLEVKTSVDQTGGMVMCLRVPIGRPDGDFGETSRWAWFSELSELEPGVGLYDGADEDDTGDFREWPGGHAPHGGDCSWRDHPDLSREVAAWAAPLIVEFAAEGPRR